MASQCPTYAIFLVTQACLWDGHWRALGGFGCSSGTSFFLLRCLLYQLVKCTGGAL